MLQHVVSKAMLQLVLNLVFKQELAKKASTYFGLF